MHTENRTIRTIFLMIMAAALCFILPSCSGYRDIRLTSCEVKTITPTGLRNVTVTVEAGFFNPASDVSVNYATGNIFLNGKEMANIEIPPFVIEGKSENASVSVPLKISLSQGFSFMETLSMLRSFDERDLTADAEIKIKVRGVNKKLKFKNISIADLRRLTESSEAADKQIAL